MLPLLLLAGLVAVVVANNDNDGGGAPIPASVDGDTIALTCDEALALIPEVARGPIATAISAGTSAPGLRALADYLETTAASSAGSERIAAAYIIAAHCLRAREASLPTPTAAAATGAVSRNFTADTRSYGYRADFEG